MAREGCGNLNCLRPVGRRGENRWEGEKWCLGPDSNRHGDKPRGILSPLRLPIPPPRQGGQGWHQPRGRRRPNPAAALRREENCF